MKTNSLGQFVRDDLTGKRFGTATIGPEFQKMPNGGTKWPYTCDCGGTGWAWAETLKREPNFCCKECRKARIARARTTHGMRYTAEYKIWILIKNRCCNPNSDNWPSYGGRGVTMCDRWKSSFENFFEDMGKRPNPHLTVERVNNNGNYEPGNCIWATRVVQANNRRTNKKISFEGKTQTISQWARERGMDKTTIRKRLKMGWPIDRVLSLDDFRKG